MNIYVYIVFIKNMKVKRHATDWKKKFANECIQQRICM